MNKKTWISLFALALVVIMGFTQLGFERLGQAWTLLSVLVLLPLVWLMRSSERKQNLRLQKIYDSGLLKRLFNPNRLQTPWVRYGVWLAIWLCLCMALARPQGQPVLSETSGEGIDLIMALDVSDSMNAADEYPSRLQAAKQGVSALLQQMSGDRVSLIAFSGDAFPIAPFTHDYDALQTLLVDVDSRYLPSATTDLENALQLSLERFQQSREKAAEVGQVLIIFSDGENQQGKYDDDLAALSKAGVRIYTVGVGTTTGARIPVQSNSFFSLAFKTWQGQEVISRLDEKTLTKIAKAGQGQYLPIKKLGQLPALLERARGELKTASFQATGVQSYQERYRAWLVLALLLLFLEPWLSGRQFKQLSILKRLRFRRILKQVSQKPQQVMLLMLLPFLTAAWSWPWESFVRDWQGQREYQNKDYKGAEKGFSEGLEAAPNNPVLQNNQGSARYREQEFPGAIESFKNNLENPLATPEQKAQSYYNLGNSYYQQGKAGGKSEEAWKQSIQAYQESLKLNPQDKQALENLNFVQQQLAQEQQQKQQGQQDPKDQKNQQQNKKDQQQQQQGQPDPKNQDPGKGQSSGGANQKPKKSETSPLDNQFTDQEIEKYLDDLKGNEQYKRDDFQRLPPQNPYSANTDPWKNQSDPNLKDW